MEPLKKQMISRLKDYATSYEEEAWEDFERFRKKKKRRPLVLFFRVAAGVLVFAGLGWGLFRHTSAEEAGSDTNSPRTLTEKTGAETPRPENSKNGISLKPEVLKKPLAQKKEGSRQERHEKRGEEAEVSVPELVLPPDFDQPDYTNARLHPNLEVHPRHLRVSASAKATQEKEEESVKIPKEIRLSLALASQSNQANNHIPDQNFGLRGTSELVLNKKTAIGTGLYLGRESLNLRNTGMPDPMSGGQALLKEVNYRWLNVEVPLTVRYNLLDGHSFEISTQAGVSMMGALGQTSAFRYENTRSVTEVFVGENGEVQQNTQVLTEKEVRTNTSNARRFSLGTALNLSVGIHYPVGKNQLSVEPFFRYPLGSFTFERLNFSSVGIQLKWTALRAKSDKLKVTN